MVKTKKLNNYPAISKRTKAEIKAGKAALKVYKPPVYKPPISTFSVSSYPKDWYKDDIRPTLPDIDGNVKVPEQVIRDMEKANSYYKPTTFDYIVKELEKYLTQLNENVFKPDATDRDKGRAEVAQAIVNALKGVEIHV